MTAAALKAIIADPQQAAKAAGLVYVNDSMPGYARQQSGKGFDYFEKEGKKVTDTEELIRIKSLVLPPAWTDVWICAKPNGHLQATGIDSAGRKQYRYHPGWNKLRNETKFFRMLQFAKVLPLIREQLIKDIALLGLPLQKVLATVVSIMEHTFIRIGSAEYEKLYGSYGLTTMRDKHVKIEGSTVKFSFKGKKGIYHDVKMQSPRLARIIKKCRDLPGYELFQYVDDEGNKRTIGSGDVNEYLKQISGGMDITSKDFRTWAGTVHALKAFHQIGKYENNTQAKKNIVQAIDNVAVLLGNTRTVCKKYYIHPAIIDAYQQGCLFNYLRALEKMEQGEKESGLTCEERLVVKVLKAMSESLPGLKKSA